MSNVKKGLAALRQYQEEQKAKEEARNRPKADWFKWPKGVTVATVRFLQELDPDATNYDEKRDLALLAVEHQAPGNEGWKRRALCTLDSEGQCYACERHAQNPQEGWKQKTNLYINALVDFGNGEEPKVLVIQRNANSTFTQALIEEAVDEGSITDANYKITKTGEGTKTQWLLKRLKGEPMNDAAVEVFNLNETALRDVPYEKQADYYGAVYGGTESDEDAPSTSSAPADDEW